jgi:cyclic pyranopterin phosphate synthase
MKDPTMTPSEANGEDASVRQSDEIGIDPFGRRIDYLRISVTDRCNFRCIYCMPAEGVVQKSHDEILTLEEMGRFARIAARQGIKRIRVTGGEPLVRLGVVGFIHELHDIEGIEEVSLTTNGTLLPRFVDELKEAGLTRVNISLDTLDPEAFCAITRGGDLSAALAGIDCALAAGFNPVKINVVVMRSLHQDLFGFARMSVDRPLHVRFIEYMPIGSSSGCSGGGWDADEVIPSTEVIKEISRRGMREGLGSLIAVRKDAAPYGAGPARYFRFADAQGTVGVISPLSNHFCGECNRLRLTADGMLRPCLFSDNEFDARSALRSGDAKATEEVIVAAIRNKPEGNTFHSTDRLMAHIGG